MLYLDIATLTVCGVAWLLSLIAAVRGNDDGRDLGWAGLVILTLAIGTIVMHAAGM